MGARGRAGAARLRHVAPPRAGPARGIRARLPLPATRHAAARVRRRARRRPAGPRRPRPDRDRHAPRPPPARRPATAARTPAQGPAHPDRRPHRVLGADPRPPLAAAAVAVAGRGAPPRAPVHRRRLRAPVPRPARRRALGRRAPPRRHPLRRRHTPRGARPAHVALRLLLAPRRRGDGPGVAAVAHVPAARGRDAVGPRRAARARRTRGADRHDTRGDPRRARDAAVDDGTCAPPQPHPGRGLAAPAAPEPRGASSPAAARGARSSTR